MDQQLPPEQLQKFEGGMLELIHLVTQCLPCGVTFNTALQLNNCWALSHPIFHPFFP